MILFFKKHFIQPTTLLPLKIQISQHDCSANLVIFDFEVVIADFGALDLDEVLLLPHFLIVGLSKDKRHTCSIEIYGFTLEGAINKS